MLKAFNTKIYRKNIIPLKRIYILIIGSQIYTQRLFVAVSCVFCCIFKGTVSRDIKKYLKVYDVGSAYFDDICFSWLFFIWK